jgi:hypothetical protein
MAMAGRAVQPRLLGSFQECRLKNDKNLRSLEVPN